MITNEYSIAFSEVLDVLQHAEIDIIEKIPLEIIKKLKENSSKEYTSKIDDIDNFSISQKAKSILAVIYQDYLCDKEEKQNFKTILLKNEINYQEQLKEKYNSDNIFEKQQILEKNSKKVQNLQIIERKESFIKNIINKIKAFIKLNKKS